MSEKQSRQGARGLVHIVLPLVLAAAGVIAFLPYLDGPFILDDLHTIEQNVYLRQHLSPLYFFQNPGSTSVIPSTMTRPLLTWSYALNYRLIGNTAADFRVINLAIHVLSSILVTLLAAHAGRLRKAAPLCGILFLLLPMNAVNVAYISCRSTILAAAFYLIGLVIFARAWENPLRLSRKSAVLYVFAITLAYAAGLFTKPTAATLPAAIVLWAIAFAGRDWSADRRPCLRFAGAAVFSLVVVLGLFLIYRLAHSAPVFFPPARPWPVWQYAAAQVQAFWKYASLMAWPVNLSLQHQAWAPETAAALLNARFLLAAGALAVMIIAAARFLRKLPEIAFPALFAVVWLLPTSSVVPLNVLISENRAYLSSILLLWPLVFVFQYARQKRPAPAIVTAGAVAILFLALVISRAQAFKSELSVWRDAVRNAPEQALPWANLGTTLLSYGRAGEASKYFEKAVENDPCTSSALNNLGNIAADRGKPKQAEALYRQSLSCDPENAAALINLSRLLMGTGKEKEARAFKERLERMRPGRLQYLRQKGVAPPD